MKSLICIFALGLFSAAPVFAGTTAFELDGNDLRIPVSDAGTISYRECRTCNFKRARLANDASFELNGTTTSLDQLRQAMAQAPDKNKVIIALIYDDDAMRVTHVIARIR